MATRQVAAAVVAGGGVLLATARTALCDPKGDRVVRRPPRERPHGAAGCASRHA
jgi:hypothetical protein